jgi:hypothetical protein
MFRLFMWAALLFVLDGQFSAITAASQHRQKHNFSTSVPKHRTISPGFCEPSITYPLTNDSFFYGVHPYPFQCPRFVRTCISLCILVKLILLFSAAPQVCPMICIPFSVLHAFPSLSFWGPFGTGASMVLWWSSSVSIMSPWPD